VTLALALAACGSSSGTKAASTSATGAIPTVATNTPQVAHARIEAAQCFRAHGINIPDFTPGGGRIKQTLQIIASYPASRVQAVLQACNASVRQAFPNLMGTDLTPAQLSQRRHEALAFAQCMRASGINYPDPTAAAANPAAALDEIQSLATSSPAFKTASKTCSAEALKGG
jgi:hypothetical protein